MRARRLLLCRLGTLALAGLPAPAGAQAVGSEFQVNTYTTSFQQPDGKRAVAADASGNFVVVWTSGGQDGDYSGVFGQRYDSDGIAVGEEFQVNTYTTERQSEPSVASAASANFVVVWQSDLQDGSDEGIFGQRFDSTGVALGGEFRVNSYMTGPQESPAIASDGDGNFVVVWFNSRVSYPFTPIGIFGQRYDSAGVARGTEFRVDSGGVLYPSHPSLASDASGNFVVVWGGNNFYGDVNNVFGQRYDNSGHPLGGEFRINSQTGNAGGPSVASDASGNFVVAWLYGLQDGDGDGFGVFGQRYDNSGAHLGGEFQVNTYTTSDQYRPAFAFDASGNFVVVWESDDQDGSLFGIFGQRYDSAGVAQGGEFQVNSFTTNRQWRSSVARTGPGAFVVVWNSYGGQDGSSTGVFGQRFDFAALPTLSISDVSVNEGNLPGRASRNWALFAVTLSAPSTETVTLDYATANGTAMAPSDYAAKSGTLTLSPGQTSAVIAVRVKEDNVSESDETFFLNLSNPTNATIADGQGVGTILNDDP